MGGTRDTGTLYISIQLGLGKLQEGITNVQKQLGVLERSCAKVGFAMSAAFTAPLAGLANHALTSFRTFDKAINAAIADMALLGHGTEDIYSKLENRANEVAMATGKSAQDIAESFRVIVSAGYTGEAALANVGIVAMLAKNAYMTTAEAARALLTAQTALQWKTDDVAQSQANLLRITDVLTASYLSAPALLSEMSAAIGSKLAGMMQTFHVSLEDGIAMLIGLAEAGTKGANASTAMSMLITQVTTKSIKNAKSWKEAHIAAYDEVSHRLRPLPAILQDIDNKMKGMDDPQRAGFLANVLGFDQRTIKNILPLINRGESVAKNARKLFEDANGLSVKMLKEQMKTLDFALNELKVKWEIVMRDIGKAQGPILIGFLTMVNKIGEAFVALSPKTKSFVVVLGLIAAATGPIMFVLHSIILMLTPFTIALMAAAAAGAAIYTYWDEIEEAVRKSYGYAAGFTKAMVEAGGVEVPDDFWTRFANNWQVLVSDTIIEGVAWFEQTFIASIENIWDAFGKFFTMTGQAFVEWVDWWCNIIKIKWAESVKTLTEIWNLFGDAFPQLADRAVEVWQTIKTVACHYLDIILQKINAVITRISEMSGVLAVRQAMSSAWNWVSGASGAVSSGAANTAGIKASTEAEKEFAQALKDRAAAQDEAAGKKADEHITKLLAQANAGVKATSTYQGLNEEGGKFFPEGLSKGTKKLSEQEKAAKTAATALEDLDQKYRKLQEDSALQKLNDDLDRAIKSGDRGMFETLKQGVYDATYNGAMVGLEDAVNKTAGTNMHGDALAKAMAIASDTGEKAVDKLNDRWLDGQVKAGRVASKEMSKDFQQAYAESISFWKSTFSAALNGDTMDFSKSWKDLAASFGAEIMTSLVGGLSKDLSSLEGIGSIIGKGFLSLVGSAFGTGTSAGGAGAAGGTAGGGGIGGLGGMIGSLFGGSDVNIPPDGQYGPMNADGTFTQADGTVVAGSNSAASIGAGVTAGVQTIIAGISAGGTDKKNKDNSGTGAAIGMGAGAAVGSIFGPVGTMVGAQVGQIAGGMIGGLFKWGPQNPETIARHAFANYIEDTFHKLGQVSFVDAKGKLQNTKGSTYNFLEGSSKRFNEDAPVNWAQDMAKYGDKAVTTFTGLGVALKDVLGLTEEVGGQLGYLLADNLGGSIDNARLLVAQLGVSFEDLQKKLLESAVAGNMTWHDYLVNLQGVAEAFKPGIEAVAAYGQAFQNLVDSGGRGMSAVKSFKDVAAEGIEGKLKSIDELQAKMRAAAKSPEELKEIDAMFAAAKARGIKTLEEWANASNELAGSVVGDMYALDKGLADKWDVMSTKLDDITEKLNAIPDKITSDIELNVTANLSDDAKSVLDSGTATGIQVNSSVGSATKNARGAVLRGPVLFSHSQGFGIAGEGGAEGILPLTKVNGSLGVSASGLRSSGGQVHLHIDARGADAGVEDRIIHAVSEMESRIIEMFE